LKLTDKFHIIVHLRNALEHSDTDTTLFCILSQSHKPQVSSSQNYIFSLSCTIPKNGDIDLVSCSYVW